jgi:hypothetical protein
VVGKFHKRVETCLDMSTTSSLRHALLAGKFHKRV